MRQTLADDVALRITQFIHSAACEPGARLPAIARMARDFGVGEPTLREGLKKLETVGVVSIRHGSGVYVGRSPDALLITNPVGGIPATKKLLIDLIDARIPIELQTASLAARHATVAHLDEMERLLARAGEHLADDTILNRENLSFHRQIALASGNVVMHQILDVLTTLFRQEQRLIMDIHGHREEDHAEHLAICQAIRARDADRAMQLMRLHLEHVRDVLQRWEPEGTAVT